jgi:hypothetical protein
MTSALIGQTVPTVATISEDIDFLRALAHVIKHTL